MKLNISNPATGARKQIEVEDQKMLVPFYDQRISADVPADSLGDMWKGAVLRIVGGTDRQGFPMMQGVLTNTRVRLLLDGNNGCFRVKREGSRQRKSVRGCIVGPDISMLNLNLVKAGDVEIPGLTDKESAVPRRLGPKRASKIVKMFSLSRDDDIRQYVLKYARKLDKKSGKSKQFTQHKAPKIQRLITPKTEYRRRHRRTVDKKRKLARKADAAAYAKLLAQRKQEAHERRASSMRRQSAKSDKKVEVKATDKKEVKK